MPLAGLIEATHPVPDPPTGGSFYLTETALSMSTQNLPARRDRPQTTEDFVREIKEAADKLIVDGASRGDVKLLCTAFKELRHCFKVFGRYKGIRKATVFGSART